MADIKCPHCGNFIVKGESDYYGCQECSTLFHASVSADGKVESELA